MCQGIHIKMFLYVLCIEKGSKYLGWQLKSCFVMIPKKINNTKTDWLDFGYTIVWIKYHRKIR